MAFSLFEERKPLKVFCDSASLLHFFFNGTTLVFLKHKLAETGIETCNRRIWVLSNYKFYKLREFPHQG